MTTPDFSRPCQTCSNGEHGQCKDPACGCIVAHPDDFPEMRGFKRLKRLLHPGTRGLDKRRLVAA